MLCLSRKNQEKLIILTPSGERINVQVLEIRGDKVRLGVEAPEEVRVVRAEVLEREKTG